MCRPSSYGIAALLGISLLILFSAGAIVGPQVVAQEEEEEEDADIPELDEVRGLIMELNLEEAETAYKAAKKELRKRKREKPVKRALAAVEKNIEALEEFEKAKKYADDGKIAKALKSITKVMGRYGDLIFADEAETLYSEMKKKAYYMINDFETEEYRAGEMTSTTKSGASVEVNEDRRLARDGRHSLKVHFDARGDGVKREAPESFRAVILKTPDGFARELEGLRALTFSIFSYKKTNAIIDLTISGGGPSAYAEYPGITLGQQGWREYKVSLQQFKHKGTFQLRDARNIVFSTRGPLEVDFIVDDVKFLR